jgi:hypothetical protein
MINPVFECRKIHRSATVYEKERKSALDGKNSVLSNEKTLELVNHVACDARMTATFLKSQQTENFQRRQVRNLLLTRAMGFAADFSAPPSYRAAPNVHAMSPVPIWTWSSLSPRPFRSSATT